MKSVGIFEAKTRLSELCREVEQTGETIVIERRGHPVAALSPHQPAARESRGILKDLAEFEKNHPREPYEPEFPDVWSDRSMPGASPLE